MWAQGNYEAFKPEWDNNLNTWKLIESSQVRDQKANFNNQDSLWKS